MLNTGRIYLNGSDAVVFYDKSKNLASLDL